MLVSDIFCDEHKQVQLLVTVKVTVWLLRGKTSQLKIFLGEKNLSMFQGNWFSRDLHHLRAWWTYSFLEHSSRLSRPSASHKKVSE